MDIEQLTDEELMGHVGEGGSIGSRSLGVLHQRYNTSLRGFLLLNRRAAIIGIDDVTQATWLRILERPKNSFDINKGQFSTWLYRIATNVTNSICISKGCIKRGGQVKKHHPIHEIPKEVGEPSVNLLTGVKPPAPVDDSILREKCSLIRRAVTKLSTKHREAVEKVYLSSNTLREVSDETGIQISTLSHRCKIARRKLASALTMFDKGVCDAV